jgi:hypothetical protein
MEVRVVVCDDVAERREPPVVAIAAIAVGPEALERRRAIPALGRRFALKASMPISSAVRRFPPGSVKSGGT